MGGVYNPFNLNTYAYSHQNPVKLLDPDGEVVGFALAAAAYTAVAVAIIRATPVIVRGAKRLGRLLGDKIGPLLSRTNKVTSLLNKADFIQTTKKGKTLTDHYKRAGGFKQANKDFDKLTKGLKVIREVNSKGVIRRTTLKSGEKINVRNYSSESSPTLEILREGGTKKEITKIRYE